MVQESFWIPTLSTALNFVILQTQSKKAKCLCKQGFVMFANIFFRVRQTFSHFEMVAGFLWKGISVSVQIL